jgi:membrane-bound lytic murein transglycosylase D
MKMSLPGVIVALLALAGPAMAAEPELPNQGLESRIEFWKKVYTQYGADDYIIHDRIHVNLIYDVADQASAKSRVRAIADALNEIKLNLGNPESLSLTTRQVYDAVAASGLTITVSLLDELRTNIHTQRGIKERFRQGVVRSGRYLEAFQQIFQKEGVPQTIALLPLVESSFENRAYSKAGAAGIWQFTRGTGRMYLRINRSVDERLDPAKAARAAARLLRDNHQTLGNWPLAITAYNHGRAGMQRARNAHGNEITTIIDDYRGPLFGYASMNFYAEFLAAVEVYENYPQYFGELVLDTPTMRQSVAPAKAAPKVAAAKAAPAKTAAAAAADKYKVRRGDTLAEIARRFGTSIRELMETNKLRNSMIYAGQILVLR